MLQLGGEKALEYIMLKKITLALAVFVLIKITWSANTENDLAGYKIYDGLFSGYYSRVTTVEKDATSAFLVRWKTTMTRYFVVTAFDTSGNESDFSAEVSLLGN